MLYERWKKVARKNGPRMAVTDVVTGRQWTFSDLDDALKTKAGHLPQSIVYPHGHSVEFILAVLRAWKSNVAACPLESGQPPPDLPPVPKHFCHLKTTSATTGKPRMIAFTESQLAADIDNLVSTMGLRPDWPNLGVISLAHSYGFSNLVMPLLLYGIPLILTPGPLPEVVRKAAAQFPDLTLPGVPTLWDAWFKAKSIPPNVRLAISAGAPLSATIEQKIFNQTGLKIHNFYGSSECGGIAYDAAGAPRMDDSFVGTPVNNVQVATARNGCLTVAGKAVGETYWPQPEDNLAKGLFITSDLADIKDHKVFLKGRLGDLINVAGRKVAPATIEHILLTHPGVASCLVFGAPGNKTARTEHIVACVVLREQGTLSALRTYAMEKLPGWQVPKDWWVTPAISPNTRGKLSRSEWKKRYVELKQKHQSGL